MKWAILSDIHGNLPALETVLQHMKTQKVDKVVFTGDLVGKGPSSEACVRRLHEEIGDVAWRRMCVKGNNDKALHMGSWTKYEEDSRASLEWASKEISKESIKWLSQLSEKPLILDNFLTIIHSTLVDSVGEFTYMYDNDFNIVESFLLMQTPVCIFGHTHRPVIYSAVPKPPPHIFRFDRIIPNETVQPEQSKTAFEQVIYDYGYQIANGKRLLVCAGSIGQPRDGDSRASYLVIDDEEEKFYFYRLSYDVEATVDELKKLSEKYRSYEQVIAKTIDRLRAGS